MRMEDTQSLGSAGLSRRRRIQRHLGWRGWHYLAWILVPVAILDGVLYARTEGLVVVTTAVIAAIAAVLAAIGYRLRTAYLQRRRRDLAARVDRRAREARTAREANRAKDRFLAVLGHELRTPLTPVLLSVRSLLEESDITPETREQLEMIRRNIELEARLLDDLFDLSRIERGLLRLDRECVDLHEVIRRALEICSASIFEADLEVIEEFAAQAHHVEGDPARLTQLCWNLIRNAARFAPAGSTLRIRSFNDDHGIGGPAPGTACRCGSEASSSADGAPLVVVEFQDTGIGIAPECLERIFNPALLPQAHRRKSNSIEDHRPESTNTPTLIDPDLIHYNPPADPDLAAVVSAWDRLPLAVRAGIVAMVWAASK
jgi:signal transduction histidine kinase